MVDLVNNPKYAERIKVMRDQMMAELKSQEDPRMFGKGYVFDHYLPTEGRGKIFMASS